MVHTSELIAVSACGLDLLGLSCSRRGVREGLRLTLCSARLCLDPALTTVEADARSARRFNALVVGVVNDIHVDIVDRLVVVEVPIPPVAAAIADTAITKAVVDAAVEADMGTPVAFVEEVATAVAITPVARRPEISRLWCLDPAAWHKIIVVTVPGPIARRPEVIWRGNRRLNVNRNGGRRNTDRNADADLRVGRRRQHGERAD